MLNGERPEGCSYCWKMEDTGEMSDRHYRSGEPWAIQDFESIKDNPIDSGWTPRYVEVNFNKEIIEEINFIHKNNPNPAP